MQRLISLLSATIVSISLLFSLSPAHEVEMIPYQPFASLGDDPPAFVPGEGPPLTTVLPDSGYPSLIDSLVDYGGGASSPTNYSNARHVVHNHREGWPAVAYEYGESRDNDVTFFKWNEFGFWEPPQTISDQQLDAGRVGLAEDYGGNIHAVWHQTDDGGHYYSRYARLLHGSWDWTDHETVSESPDDDGAFPSITVDYNDNIWVVYNEGEIGVPNEICVNHSNDGGVTWVGKETIPGGPYDQGWQLPTLDAGRDGTIHAQFMGGGDAGDVYYSYRDPGTGEWAMGETAALHAGSAALYTATMAVDSRDEVHMTGVQSFGWGSNYGNIGVLKYWHGTYGNWSDIETPFLFQQGTQNAWMDSFATYPTLSRNDCDDIVIAWAQCDTVVDQRAVSGLYSSYLKAGIDEWSPVLHQTSYDEWDVIYPQLIHRIGDSGMSIPGVGVVWGAMVAGAQPASVYYMNLGDMVPCIPSGVPFITIDPEFFDIETVPDAVVEEMLVIGNLGEEILLYQLSDDAEWLSVSPVSGSVPGGEADSVTVTFDSSDLGLGSYSTTIIVESNADNEPLIEIPVEMQVTGEIGIFLTPYETVLLRGDTLRYDIEIINSTDETQSFDFATGVTLPNGNPYGPLVGPVTIEGLLPGWKIKGYVEHRIPYSAPYGNYFYYAVAFEGFTIMGMDRFGFVVNVTGDPCGSESRCSPKITDENRTISSLIPCNRLESSSLKVDPVTFAQDWEIITLKMDFAEVMN